MTEATAGWSYTINYGPDGQEDWANLITPNGQHVANIRTHHAQAIVAACNGQHAASGGSAAAESVEEDERGFRAGDYTHVAELLRSNEATRSATASNNHNVILAALDLAAARLKAVA